MRKALKYFMLALLIVPCALAFTACGGTKQMSSANVAKYAYNVSKQYAKDNKYDEYQDLTITKKVNTTINYQENVTYKETAAGETVTELKDHKSITNSEFTLTRKGKGKDAVVKILLKESQTNIEPTVKEDLTLSGKNTQSTTTTTQTWLFGRVGNEDAVYYVLLEERVTNSVIIDDVAQTEGLDEPVVSKYSYSSIEESDFEDILNNLFVDIEQHHENELENPATSLLNSLSAEYDSLSKVEKKSGVEVEGKLVEFEGTRLTTTTKAAKFSNNRVDSYKATKETEGVDYTIKTTIETTWSYAADAVAMPAEFTDFNHKLTGEQEGLLDELLGFNSYILNYSSGD